ncbi:hypothetical protein HG536_0D03700 [Torulaspora globosa]|uniref:Tetratricopeptide SHNi-TPR domain-containing protein n=1 Tax=Torulaspora globosa TaxID=48254 RepID=A0A7G3ZH62_9SACH|nr:uncharacterized protein HG536_0D03700 [Torulaspora globosa]QLL32848.1 hypothetical protein HG536_0D03700 [Torulaspora globosa]
MSGSEAAAEMCREVKDLLIEGAKYTANGDLEKAVKCYTKVLDLESQKPEPYVLLARCLYQTGLKRNDIFGGQQGDGQLGQGEDDEEEDDEDMSDSEESSSSDRNRPAVGPLNSRLYQFDHEEEEELDDVEPRDEPGEEDVREGSIPEGSDEADEERSDDDLSPADGFENYLQGDLFENALELLYRARIMYMESAKPSEEMPEDFQMKLVEVYDLLGDIDQELEDFAQAVRDYDEAISMCQNASSQESNDQILTIYMKLAEALKWMDPASDITPEQHKEHLIKIKRLLKARIRSGETIHIEEDELRLQKINEDLKALKANPQEAGLDKNSMMQAILKQALEATKRGEVNDLSKMVKKNRKKPL